MPYHALLTAKPKVPYPLPLLPLLPKTMEPGIIATLLLETMRASRTYSPVCRSDSLVPTQDLVNDHVAAQAMLLDLPTCHVASQPWISMLMQDTVYPTNAAAITKHKHNASRDAATIVPATDIYMIYNIRVY
jgi:hypothetical protein